MTFSADLELLLELKRIEIGLLHEQVIELEVEIRTRRNIATLHQRRKPAAPRQEEITYRTVFDSPNVKRKKP